ncbi:MAG: hypothetical protein KBS35_01740 [Mycoplasma sp.]|nr:hypothetical protein [Candidatus Hennigella equi]
MIKKDIPYKYYKTVLIWVWALAILCVIGTWIAFPIGGPAAITFAAIVSTFLTLAIALLSAMLIISGRPDYKTKGIIVAVLAGIHFIFFVAVLACQKLIHTDAQIFALPAVHTIILLAIAGFGVYFSARNRFVFKNPAKEDAMAAFGGPVEGAQPDATQPKADEQPKQARDEKTGIVSL